MDIEYQFAIFMIGTISAILLILFYLHKKVTKEEKKSSRNIALSGIGWGLMMIALLISIPTLFQDNSTRYFSLFLSLSCGIIGILLTSKYKSPTVPKNQTKDIKTTKKDLFWIFVIILVMAVIFYLLFWVVSR
jgi:phosphatidylserine synthase